MKDPCTCNKELVQEVKDFIKHVKDVKEESITDYLMWKWKEFDPRFKCIVTKTHTRQEEHDTTGADFDLELWILTNTKPVSFAVQAKKFIKPHNSYVSKLKYPKNSEQIDKLLSHS